MGPGARRAGSKSDLSPTETTSPTIAAGLADTRRFALHPPRYVTDGSDDLIKVGGQQHGQVGVVRRNNLLNIALHCRQIPNNYLRLAATCQPGNTDRVMTVSPPGIDARLGSLLGRPLGPRPDSPI